MINVAEILKDCPSGMELDCTMFDNVTFVRVDDNREQFPIEIALSGIRSKYLTKEGCFHDTELLPESKCVIFPKGKTTWDGFQRPFKDGDILANVFGGIVIYKGKMEHNKKLVDYYCGYRSCDNTFIVKEHKDSYFGHINDSYYATEEEKQKLFDAIKANGYKWNEKTKTLEKSNSFYTGEILVSSVGNIVLVSHVDDKGIIYYHCILDPLGGFRIQETPDCGVGKISNCTLASEEQRNKLFNRLKKSGYKYNPRANKLEKLLNFKVGDRIKKKGDHISGIITQIDIDNFYKVEYCGGGVSYINSKYQDDYELVTNILTNKFNINTLVPFESRVLVRDVDHNEWEGAVFGRYDGNMFFTIGGIDWKYCIPYEGNEHLLGKTNDCDEFYKIW